MFVLQIHGLASDNLLMSDKLLVDESSVQCFDSKQARRKKSLVGSTTSRFTLQSSEVVKLWITCLSHPTGSIVEAILASDSDSELNGEVTYSLEEDDEDGTFLLNPVTGVFNVTRALDYETQRYYILTAKAQDGGGLASTVRVYFNVLDINDNPPIFSSNAYSSSVSESLPPGSSIVTVQASDGDDGR